jgi:hypothetical protein
MRREALHSRLVAAKRETIASRLLCGAQGLPRLPGLTPPTRWRISCRTRIWGRARVRGAKGAPLNLLTRHRPVGIGCDSDGSESLPAHRGGSSAAGSLAGRTGLQALASVSPRWCGMRTPMSAKSSGLTSSGHPRAGGSGGPTEPLRHRRLRVAGPGPHAP